MSLQDYLGFIEKEEHRDYFANLLDWVNQTFPSLDLMIKWNQPMFVYKGTFIISFNASKKYVTVAIEKPILDEVVEDILKAGYSMKKMVFHINYLDVVAYDLLEKIINKVLELKKDCSGFWLER